VSLNSRLESIKEEKKGPFDPEQLLACRLPERGQTTIGVRVSPLSSAYGTYTTVKNSGIQTFVTTDDRCEVPKLRSS